MIFILARESDEAAKELTQRWSNAGARLLAPYALSMPGWRHRVSSASDSSVMLEGIAVKIADIRGVLVRLPGIANSDLPHIIAADRSYVAMEMTAFLLAWLTSLPCPVLNRPTPSCLAGPCLRTEQWIWLAAGVGVPVADVFRTSKGYAPATHDLGFATAVTVVGETCMGALSPLQAEYAHRIARAVNVNLLEVSFIGAKEDPLFIGANIYVNLSDVTVADAVLALFQSGHPRGEEVRP